MAEFSGIKQEDHQKLERAARMYSNATGEDVTGIVGQIPTAKPEEDAKAKAEREQRRTEQTAAANREVEEADRRARQLRNQRDTGEVQDENPGPGQPAMVTERAKAAGISRKGEEPNMARRK